ncbi:YciK family oxidoreductase [Gynuella sp.]|uniref:YciK family oxidoreductase n=1 Tax=Gynuella sp. TaxID=2969146 RepID=UPI003D14FEEF
MESKIITNIVPAGWQPDTQELQGKNILITGASSGIGQCAAIECAKYGATVILLGRNQEKLEQVYDEIVQQGYPEPMIYILDLATATVDDYRTLARAVEEELEQLDVLLLNAAILGQRSPISSFKPDVWQQTMKTNVDSCFYLCRYLLPSIQKSEAGRILFTSSSVGRMGRAYWGAYAVSKFAVEGLMQTLADELENISTVRVNSINPKGTQSAMRAQAYPAENPETLKSPKQLMPLYLYLMSKQSQHIHGQMIDY